FHGAISWRASLAGNAHSGLLSSAYAAPDATKSGKTRKGRAVSTVKRVQAAKFFGSRPLPFCWAHEPSFAWQQRALGAPRCDRSKWRARCGCDRITLTFEKAQTLPKCF